MAFVKDDQTITDATVAAVGAMCRSLEGLNMDEAAVAVLNVAARVIATHADSPEDAKRRAFIMGKSIAQVIRQNWPTIERERAGNGGKQPEWNQ